MPVAQFHLRHAGPSIRMEGSPAVLAMTGHEPRRSIHHHSLLSAVGRSRCPHLRCGQPGCLSHWLLADSQFFVYQTRILGAASRRLSGHHP